jgi:hypothetical protein
MEQGERSELALLAASPYHFAGSVQCGGIPEEDAQEPARNRVPDDHYPEEKIERALNDLHLAMEALEMATWRLEGIVNRHENQVGGSCGETSTHFRAMVAGRSKENVLLTGYGYDHDRYISLLEETPNMDYDECWRDLGLTNGSVLVLRVVG